MFVAFLALFPALALLTLSGFELSEVSIATFALIAVLAIWIALTARSFAQFYCPRCGEYFAGFRSWWSRRGFLLSRRCPHCDLKQFSSDDDSR
jgi:predicted RNA-binding Zn-ribbon protein involved in translation (DUF1610 family)